MANTLPVLDLISAEMRAVVAKSNELAADAYDTSADLPALRAGYNLERRFWNEGGPVMASTTDVTVPTPAGPVAIRCHRPPAAPGVSPAIVYIHGGGFVLGNLATHDRIMRILAEETGAVVVGVDYALSPEAKFPVALHQCAGVVQWLQAHGAGLGIDPARLACAGDSGGAMLSLATFLYLRDQGAAEPLRALLLYYGLYGLTDSASRRLLGGPWD
ncbi:MAG: alpha/beta hydrolase fold domain-containing protein, partial [Propionibacteriaceae bacterium]|nr:alpha/beta hydrolase fold domain-containing protein [Propionibacteriaceae bacterium]